MSGSLLQSFVVFVSAVFGFIHLSNPETLKVSTLPAAVAAAEYSTVASS